MTDQTAPARCPPRRGWRWPSRAALGELALHRFRDEAADTAAATEEAVGSLPDARAVLRSTSTLSSLATGLQQARPDA